MADFAGAQILRLWRKSQERIDLAVGKKLRRPGRGTRDPLNIPGRIEADMGGHRVKEKVRAGAEALDAYFLSLQVQDAADVFPRKQFEAADVLAAHDGDRFAGIDRDQERGRIIRGEVDF